jgi:hypothetical protein
MVAIRGAKNVRIEFGELTQGNSYFKILHWSSFKKVRVLLKAKKKKIIYGIYVYSLILRTINANFKALDR